MTVRADLMISLDGFGTGEGQSIDTPFGHAGMRLAQAMHGTASFNSRVLGKPGGTRGINDAFAVQYFDGVGAEIMGANKFGPPGWQENEEWKGWWGDTPPWTCPVFVLTHSPRADLEFPDMSFRFLDAPIEEALERATAAANGLDVRIGGGPSTARAYLAAGLIDVLHLTIVPIVLGRGVALWEGLEGFESEFVGESVSAPDGVTHLVLQRRSLVE